MPQKPVIEDLARPGLTVEDIAKAYAQMAAEDVKPKHWSGRKGSSAMLGVSGVKSNAGETPTRTIGSGTCRNSGDSFRGPGSKGSRQLG